jgi:hypothetical protein
VKKKYLPKTSGGKLTRLSEECAEVIEAAQKTLRVFMEQPYAGIDSALDSFNPELPVSKRETNRDWILREIKDLEHAILQVKKAIS